jgi:hypothetical protein
MFKYLFFFLVSVYGHARITNPIPRLKNVSGGLNAPVYTCLGPVFQTSSTSMRCHDTPSGNIMATYTSGNVVNLEWIMEAPHPGDCSVWISYDNNINFPINWIKLKDIPGCLSPTGIDSPVGINKYSFKLSEFLPSCDHCVLRWEWYAVQQVSNVEFYVNCIDIKIISQNNCELPSPTTEINGIEHLLYNLHDNTQNGCPFYNVYDTNLRPQIEKRSRGPKEWVPSCNNFTPITQPNTIKPPIIIYPCDNINCGTFGTCNIGGLCECKNGYTGKNCEIPPIIVCNTNCKILNRKNCQSNNICGNCLNGFIGEKNGNTLCKIQCNNDKCKSLNRKKCIRPNVCGTCLLGFTEPNSFKKSDSCINLPNKNNINLSITAQWETGFCGQWIITCPLNREIFFIIPEQLRDIRGWNMINMQKINNKIVGSCAEWVITGNTAIGGFCASFDYGKSVIINNDGYFFQNNILRRNLLDNQNILDTTYRNVSITMNIESNNLNYENVINNFKNNLYGTSDIIILNNQDSELSLKIDCKNRQDFDSALFLHVDMIDNIPVNYDLFYKEPINNENELKNSSNKINYPFYFILIILAIFIV